MIHNNIIKRFSTVFILLLITSSVAVFAQKEVRKDIREGNKSYKEKLYNAAEASYKSALEKNESDPTALYNLGNTYYEQGNWDEALKTYEKYLSVEKDDAQKMSSAWHNIGNSLLRKKDTQKSMEAYKNALRLNPADDETRYNLAVVQKMIKDQQDKDDQNKDKNKDQDKKDQDKNKDQNKDQNKDNKDQDKDNKDNKDQNKDNKDQNKDQQNQMSQENIQQMLKAIEQDEKETQERVQQMKAKDRKKQNENNRRQNKDW